MIQEEIKTKKCSICRQYKPLTEFYKSKKCKDGYRSICKDCIRERSGYKKKEEVRKVIDGILYKRCSRCKQWKPVEEFCKHKGSKDGFDNICKICKKEVYYEHSEEISKRNKEKRKQNPEKYGEYNRKKYERKRKDIYRYWTGNTVRSHRGRGIIVKDEDYIEEKARNTPNCQICNCKLVYGNNGTVKDNSATLDRKNNEKEINKNNFMIICHRCNRIKSNMTLQEFLDYCAYITKNKDDILIKTHTQK